MGGILQVDTIQNNNTSTLITQTNATTITIGTTGQTITIPSGVTFNTASASISLPTTIQVNTIQNTNSSTLITQTNSTTITVGVSGQTVALPSQSISYAAISNAVDFRNIVINGDMKVAQRSTSVASITTTGYYTVDRFKTLISSLGTFTQSQSTDVPTGQGFANSFKLDCTTADASPAAGDYLILQQNFEGQNLQYLKKGTANALPLTLSFWVKSTKTGTFIAELYDDDNARNISKSYTVSVSNTWEFKTITYAGDTTGAFTNDNGNSLSLNFWLGAGTTYTSGALATSWASTTDANRAVGQVNIADNTANDFLITGVQLEAGEQASGFEFLPIDTNLSRCLRYYFNLVNGTDNEIGIGAYISATELNNIIQFPVLMRAGPTLDIVTGTDYYKITRNGGTDRFNSFTIARATTRNCLIYNSTEISGTSGQAGETMSGNASAFLSFTAEL